MHLCFIQVRLSKIYARYLRRRFKQKMKVIPLGDRQMLAMEKFESRPMFPQRSERKKTVKSRLEVSVFFNAFQEKVKWC